MFVAPITTIHPKCHVMATLLQTEPFIANIKMKGTLLQVMDQATIYTTYQKSTTSPLKDFLKISSLYLLCFPFVEVKRNIG